MTLDMFLIMFFPRGSELLSCFYLQKKHYWQDVLDGHTNDDDGGGVKKEV